jgi:hypothetical protein
MVDEARIAEVEEGPLCQLGVAKHGMGDLQSGQRVALVVLEPRMVELGIVGQRAEQRAVALAEHADEERPRALDLIEADLQGLALLGLLFCDPPAQVDVDEVEVPIRHSLAELGKDHLDQVIPLCVHVAEGAADEDADGLPALRHRTSSPPPVSPRPVRWAVGGQQTLFAYLFGRRPNSVDIKHR